MVTVTGNSYLKCLSQVCWERRVWAWGTKVKEGAPKVHKDDEVLQSHLFNITQGIKAKPLHLMISCLPGMRPRHACVWAICWNSWVHFQTIAGQTVPLSQPPRVSILGRTASPSCQWATPDTGLLLCMRCSCFCGPIPTQNVNTPDPASDVGTTPPH